MVLRVRLERASDDAARQTAQEVVALVDGGRLPDPVPAGGTTLVQVVDEQGRVLAASAGADRLVPALPADELAAALAGPITVPGSRVRGARVRFGWWPPPPAPRPSRARWWSLPRPATSTTPFGWSGSRWSSGFVLLLAVLAAIAWRLVGATLRPVEALRVGAEQITGTGSAGDPAAAPFAPTRFGGWPRLSTTCSAGSRHSRQRQRAFVADAAHELRSPLTSLRTQLEVAAATGDEPDTADLLAEVDRLTALVDDLLLLARVDDAQPPPLQHARPRRAATRIAQRFSGARVPVTLSGGVRSDRAGAGRRSQSTGCWSTCSTMPSGYAASAVTSPSPRRRRGAQVVVADDGPGVPAEERGPGVRAVHPAGRRPRPGQRRQRIWGWRSSTSWSVNWAARSAWPTRATTSTTPGCG